MNKKFLLVPLLFLASGLAQAALIETSTGDSLTAMETTLGLPGGSIAAEWNISGSGGTNANDGEAFNIANTFDVLGNGTISFDWVFGTDDANLFGTFRDDVAFLSIRNVTTSTTIALDEIVRTTSPGSGGPITLGAHNYATSNAGTHTFGGLGAGSYIIGIGIINDDNTQGFSALEFTNVLLDDDFVPSISIPSSVMLLGFGLLALRRRK